MSLVSRLFENTSVYRYWQAPFARQKFRPIYAHNQIDQIQRVLDVGCGPGTNTVHFQKADYLGIDINPAYIEYARRKFKRDFLVADATKYTVPADARYDFVLLNSFLHHVADDDVVRMLSHLATVVSDEGHIHILDLVMPDRPGIDRWLAKMDRGDYPRPLLTWKDVFTADFQPVIFEQYSVGLPGLTLWNMVYFKGKVAR